MKPDTLDKIIKETSSPEIIWIAKIAVTLYFFSRTIKTCFEIADHIDKRKEMKKRQ